MRQRTTWKIATAFLLVIGCNDVPEKDAARMITMPLFEVAEGIEGIEGMPLDSRVSVVGVGLVWLRLSRSLIATENDLSARIEARYEYRVGGRSFNGSHAPSLAVQQEMRLPATGTVRVMSVIEGSGLRFEMKVRAGGYTEFWIGVTTSPGRHSVVWHHQGLSDDYHFEYIMY